MNFGCLGASFGRMGGAGSLAYGDIGNRIQSGRVDFAILGDSNVLLSGTGWDHGLQYALSQRFPMYATGIISINENNADGSGVGYTYNYNGGSALIGAVSGAPTFHNDYLDQGTGTIFPHSYGYLASPDTVASGATSGMIVTGSGAIPTQDALRFHFVYGTFASGSGGKFGAYIRRDSSPFTIYAFQNNVSTTTGVDSIARLQVDLSADSARAGLDLGVRWTSGGITGPFFGLWSRVERTAVLNGFSVHTMNYLGGQSMRDMANAVQQMSDTTLANFISEFAVLQGSTKTLVVLVFEGLNDRNEAGTSLGPDAITDGDSAEAYVDNFKAIETRFETAWSNAGYPASGLKFIVVTPQPVSTPNDAELITYAAAIKVYAASTANVRVIDVAELASYSEILGNSWYAAGPDTNHLASPAGYESLGVRVVDRILATTFG